VHTVRQHFHRRMAMARIQLYVVRSIAYVAAAAARIMRDRAQQHRSAARRSGAAVVAASSAARGAAGCEVREASKRLAVAVPVLLPAPG
jgi:hypothetical protein